MLSSQECPWSAGLGRGESPLDPLLALSPLKSKFRKLGVSYYLCGRRPVSPNHKARDRSEFVIFWQAPGQSLSGLHVGRFSESYKTA